MYIFIFHFLHILILTFTAVYTMHITNLSPIQRIAVAEKYRPIYEKQAKENLIKAGNNYGVGKNKKPFQKSENPITPINTTKKLAKTAGVSTDTYSKGKKILNSNDEAKQRKVAVEYVKLCGYKQGGNRKSNCQVGVLKLSDIAKQLGTSERNLQRALSIERNLTEPMKQLLDNGVISKTVASDDEVLLDLLESNIRRRGEIGGSAKKLGRCIKELERIYGVREGRPEKLPKVSEVNQSNIAEMIGISVDTLQNYKLLAEMIPELSDLVDTGVVTCFLKKNPPVYNFRRDFLSKIY